MWHCIFYIIKQFTCAVLCMTGSSGCQTFKLCGSLAPLGQLPAPADRWSSRFTRLASVNKATSMDAGWGQFRQLQDRFSALIQTKWTSPVGNNKTRNVADSKRDLLFVWNAAECSILVVNVGLFANGSLGGKTHQVSFRLFCLSIRPECVPNDALTTQFPCLCHTGPARPRSAWISDSAARECYYLYHLFYSL
jgi:hypothetical protein